MEGRDEEEEGGATTREQKSARARRRPAAAGRGATGSASVAECPAVGREEQHGGQHAPSEATMCLEEDEPGRRSSARRDGRPPKGGSRSPFPSPDARSQRIPVRSVAAHSTLVRSWWLHPSALEVRSWTHALEPFLVAAAPPRSPPSLHALLEIKLSPRPKSAALDDPRW